MGTATRQTANLSQIGLHWRRSPKAWTDRGFALGGTGTGKSTVCEELMNTALLDYPKLQILILDTKPRFRAEWELNGVTARNRYKNWDHGSPIPNSYAVDLTDNTFGFDNAWKVGARVCIAQSDDAGMFGRILEAAEVFYAGARASIPRLIYADEVMDFFTMQGRALGNNWVLLKSARAGRERGLGCLYASQRAKGIPLQLVQELSMLYLFMLDNQYDIDQLVKVGGVPADIVNYVPDKEYDFYYWNRYKRLINGTYRLKMEAA